MSYTGTGTITIDHTKCGSSSTTNFPFLFYGTYAGAGSDPDLRTVGNGGAVTDTDGDDIIFCASNNPTDLLDFERISYTAASGAVIFWIRIPTLSNSSDTVIYLFYGNGSVTTFQGNTNGTWNSSYLFMIHGSNVLTDSTANARDFTCTTPTYSTGKFGTCMSNPDADALKVPARTDSGLPSGTADRTIRLWVAWVDNTIGDQPLWSYGSLGGQDQRMRQSGFTGSDVLKYIKSSDDITATFNPTINQFYYVVLTFNSSGTVAKIYIDGSNVATATKSGWSTTLAGSVYIFSDTFGITRAKIQEFSIRNVVESADEVLAAYNNQNSPSTFYAITATGGGGGGSGLLYGQIDLSGIGGAGRFAKLIN